MFKKTLLSNFVSAFLLAGVLASGTAQAQEPAKPELKVGFVPGPYIDEFKVGVAPELQKKGYRIRYVEFSTGLEANNAVFKGEIDANVMQHTILLNSYNDRQQTDLVGIVHVPTPPMASIRRSTRRERRSSLDRPAPSPTIPSTCSDPCGSCATSAWSKFATANRSTSPNLT
jgi:ABC-type metal ion transport system substrate-binding protein